jgi:hypothetical protein
MNRRPDYIIGTGYNTKRNFHLTTAISPDLDRSTEAAEPPKKDILLLLAMASSGGGPSECSPDCDA